MKTEIDAGILNWHSSVAVAADGQNTWPRPEKLSGAYFEALQETIEKGYWAPSGKRVGIYGGRYRLVKKQ